MIVILGACAGTSTSRADHGPEIVAKMNAFAQRVRACRDRACGDEPILAERQQATHERTRLLDCYLKRTKQAPGTDAPK